VISNKNNFIIHTDGGARGNPGPAATGFIIETGSQIVYQSGTYIGNTTNNVAEYTAVIHALTWLKTNPSSLLSISSLHFFLDSSLVVNQLNGIFKIREPHLIPLSQTIHSIISSLSLPTSFAYVPRAQNAAADRLVNHALDTS